MFAYPRSTHRGDFHSFGITRSLRYTGPHPRPEFPLLGSFYVAFAYSTASDQPPRVLRLCLLLHNVFAGDFHSFGITRSLRYTGPHPRPEFPLLGSFYVAFAYSTASDQPPRVLRPAWSVFMPSVTPGLDTSTRL